MLKKEPTPHGFDKVIIEDKPQNKEMNPHRNKSDLL